MTRLSDTQLCNSTLQFCTLKTLQLDEVIASSSLASPYVAKCNDEEQWNQVKRRDVSEAPIKEG